MDALVKRPPLEEARTGLDAPHQIVLYGPARIARFSVRVSLQRQAPGQMHWISEIFAIVPNVLELPHFEILI